MSTFQGPANVADMIFGLLVAGGGFSLIFLTSHWIFGLLIFCCGAFCVYSCAHEIKEGRY